jgi:hypothetical protein
MNPTPRIDALSKIFGVDNLKTTTDDVRNIIDETKNQIRGFIMPTVVNPTQELEIINETIKQIDVETIALTTQINDAEINQMNSIHFYMTTSIYNHRNN